MKKINFLKLAKLAVEVAEDKKGKDILLINVTKLTPIADYFLIVTAESSTQINAIIEGIEKRLKDEVDQNPLRRDGRVSISWSVIDYGGLIVHVMSEQARAFYALEKIWSGTGSRKLKTN